MNPSRSHRKVVLSVAIVALLLFGLLAAYLMRPQDDTKATGSGQPTVAEQATDQPAGSATEFNDGTDSAEGSYTSPGGSEEIEVSLTVKDGVVTDSTVTVLATNPNSKQYQTQFANGHRSEVVGKNLAELQLDAVAGSSLTPNGFNEAVTKIKSQATS